MNVGDLNAALVNADTALKYHEGSIENLMMKANVLLQMDQTSAALMILEGVNKEEPDFPGLPYYLGSTYMKKGDHKNALKFFEYARDTQPDKEEFMVNLMLAQLYFNEGQQSKSEECYTICEKLDPVRMVEMRRMARENERALKREKEKQSQEKSSNKK